jgi:signal transduction histidine kinase
MLNDLLDLNRLESGCVPMQIDVIDAADIGRTAMRTLEPFARRTDLQFADRMPNHAWVLADHDRLMQVFLNLLTNAIKFTPPGGTIAIEAEAMSRQRIELRVCDTGPGMPPEQLVRLFTRYSQLQNQGLTVETPGMGLGLSICREIVTRLGGEIGARSEPGKGSEFWFLLPTAPSPTPVPSK